MWADAQRDGRPATAGVPCSMAANMAERKTWTQSECCTWQNSVGGHNREFQLHLSPGSTSQVVSKSVYVSQCLSDSLAKTVPNHLATDSGDYHPVVSKYCKELNLKSLHWSQPAWKVTLQHHSRLNRPTWLMSKMTFSPAFWHQSLMSEYRQLTVIIYHVSYSLTVDRPCMHSCLVLSRRCLFLRKNHDF